MRSLAFKLTLAFLLVGILGAVSVAFMVRSQTQRQFNQLVMDQNEQTLVTNLTAYYRTNGGWAGVESVFRPGPANFLPGPDQNESLAERRSLFALADQNGKIVYGRGPNDDDHITAANLKKGIAININDQIVGTLVFLPSLNRWDRGTPEGNFLTEVSLASLRSAIIASALALVLGGILAYTMTRSIRELTTATTVLAQGKLGHQVKVRSQDEIGVLAQSIPIRSRIDISRN